MKETREELVKKYVKILNCTEEEAMQIVLDDEAVDAGKPMPWDLTPEQKKISRKARQAERIVSSTKKTRERKEDADKRALIHLLSDALRANTDVSDTNITNAEREIEFTYGDKKYKVTLSAPRA
jgi:hypothetical protein